MLWTDEFGKTLRNVKQDHTKEGREQVPIFFGGDNIHLKTSLLELENLKRPPGGYLQINVKTSQH